MSTHSGTLLFLLLASLTQAQLSLGLHNDFQHNYYRLVDPGGKITSTNANTQSLGFDFRYQGKHLSIGLGLSLKTLRNKISFGIVETDFFHSQAIQLPLSISKQLLRSPSNLSLHLFLGAEFYFLSQTANKQSNFDFNIDQNTKVTMHSSNLVNNFGAGAFAGIECAYPISSRITIYSALAYHHGLSLLLVQSITYQTKSPKQVKTATIEDRARYLNLFSVGLRYFFESATNTN